MLKLCIRFKIDSISGLFQSLFSIACKQERESENITKRVLVLDSIISRARQIAWASAEKMLELSGRRVQRVKGADSAAAATTGPHFEPSVNMAM